MNPRLLRCERRVAPFPRLHKRASTLITLTFDRPPTTTGNRSSPPVLARQWHDQTGVGGPSSGLQRTSGMVDDGSFFVRATRNSVRGLPDPEVREVAPFAWRPVLLIAGAVAALLVAVSSRYGWHRDELYFRAAGQHLAWSYVDQPPFTPCVARMAHVVSPDNLAVRTFP